MAHERDDGDRAHSDWNSTTALAMLGRQGNADTVDAGYASFQREARDRPGRLIDGEPEDPDFSGRFTGGELKYLARRQAGRGSMWTWKLGYTQAEERDENPDALTEADPKAFPLLKLGAWGPSAEGRFDRALDSGGAWRGGLAYFAQTREVAGQIGQVTAPGPEAEVRWTDFSNTVDRQAVTGYLWRQWQPGKRLYVMAGGRAAARRDMEPVFRPEAYVRQGVGRHGTVVLLTRPVLADDVTELSPVQDWGLRDWLSPVDLALGGYSQSTELQYELLPASGSLLRLSVFDRSLANFLVDLEDPRWSAGASPLVLGSGRLTGGEIEAEQWLTRALSAGVWVRFTNSENRDEADRDVPYQPRVTGNARLDYLGENGVRASLVWLYVGKRFADLDNETELGGYGLLSLRADWQQSLHTDWFVTVDNLLDRDYAYWRDYPDTGRKARAGINYRW